jgi:myo-inositol-1(or 4)-monophosphatase
MTYLAFLESLLMDAGKLAMSFPPRMSSQVKDTDPNQIVTQADAAIGDQIRHRIRNEYPQDSIIDEEYGAVRGSSSATWIVDPIDGTSNFATGSPLYGVMVGVLDHGEPMAGGVTLPAFSETYVAEAGRGAYLDGTRLRIEPDGDLSQQLIAFGIDIHHVEIELDCQILSSLGTRCRGIRMSNSIFDCMMVAKGAYGGFMHRRNHIWDCVAAQIIIQEAGGTFSAMDGRAFDYTDPLARTEENFSILACGSQFHAAISTMNAEILSRWGSVPHAAP